MFACEHLRVLWKHLKDKYNNAWAEKLAKRIALYTLLHFNIQAGIVHSTAFQHTGRQTHRQALYTLLHFNIQAGKHIGRHSTLYCTTYRQA